MACYLECSNTFCEHQYDGYCHADEEEYYECEKQRCEYLDKDEDFRRETTGSWSFRRRYEC